MTNRNLFDDSGDEWETTSSSFDNSDVPEVDQSSKSIKLKLSFNRKIAGIIGGLIVILIAALVIPGAIGGKHSSPKSTPTPSASPSPVSVDLYAHPKLLQSFIDTALASSVTIYCGNYSGSGWAINLSDDMSTPKDDNYPTEIITNNHVIEGCETSGVTIVPMGTSTQHDASVYSYDRSNDLAILMTDLQLPPLPTIQPGHEAHVGQWVMAVGSPGAGSTTLDGSITTGTVTNIQEGVIVTDTTINPGNSGGPLLNAAGEVIAIVSAKIVDAKINNIGIARDVSLICIQLNGCTKKRLLG